MKKFVASLISTETFCWIVTVGPSIVNTYFDHGKSFAEGNNSISPVKATS